MDALDRELIALLKVNARLPVVKIAKALNCARSTVQIRLKALEDRGVIAGYTVSLAKDRDGAAKGISALLQIAVESARESDVVRALARRHEVSKVYTVSGRYDLVAFVQAETMEEFESVVDRVRSLPGVSSTHTTMVLAKKVDRPD
jgi:DNA-binding Lrp family transcriptional regulator